MDNQELELCLHLDHMDDIGFPLQLEMLEACANYSLVRAHMDPETLPNPIGSKWASRFLDRHPKDHLCIKEALDINWL